MKRVQEEDCWCNDSTAVCEEGQVCEEMDGVCRDVVKCEDPRTGRGWKEMNLVVVEEYEDFIEDTNYTFNCDENMFVEDYVRYATILSVSKHLISGPLRHHLHGRE